MCKPLPIAHVAAEPWYRALRDMKPCARPLRGLKHECRTFPQAVLEVFEGRQSVQAFETKGQ